MLGIVLTLIALFDCCQIGKVSNFYLGDETDGMDENEWILSHDDEDFDVYKHKVNPHHEVVLMKGFKSPFTHDDDLTKTATWIRPEVHEFELKSRKLTSDKDIRDIYGLKMVVRFSIQLSHGKVTDTFVSETFVVDTGGLSFLNLKPSTWRFWKDNGLLNDTEDPEIWKTQVWPGFHIPVRKTSDNVDHANLIGLPFLHPIDLHIKNSEKNDNVTLDNFPIFFSRFKMPGFEVLHPIRHSSPNFWKQEYADTRKEVEKTQKELEETKKELKKTKDEGEETKKELKKAKDEGEETRKELKKTKKELKETRNEGEKTKRNFNEFTARMQKVLEELGLPKDRCDSLTQNFEGEKENETDESAEV